MKNSKYIDISSINNVIGAIYNNPLLLENEKYNFLEEDFPSSFHKIVFGSIYNLFQSGVQKITLESIEDYLLARPKKYAEYNINKGAEYLSRCAEISNPSTFNYYYERMKKHTLLRAFEEMGLDLSEYYDPDNILDPKKLQEQNDWLDNTPAAKIVDLIDSKITQIRNTIVDGNEYEIVDLGKGIDEYLDSIKESPDIGYPLFSDLMNTVTRGARLGKFYLRSAATNVGKSRAMVADACTIGCAQRWSVEENKWISIGKCEPTLLIAIEQDVNELQTMTLAFLAGVDESHILDNNFYIGEKERVDKAKILIKESKVKFLFLPNFSLTELENIIKFSIRTFDTRYIFFDYLSTSIKILEEITKRSGGVKMREDQILYLMATRLKDIANEYDIFIMSSTQLNMDYQQSETPDQNLLRGSKSIADRIDFGCILLDVTEKDKEALAPLCKKLNKPIPNIKCSIYKNRRGGYRSMYLWINADKSICQYTPIFATDWTYRYQEINPIHIKVQEESYF